MSYQMLHVKKVCCAIAFQPLFSFSSPSSTHWIAKWNWGLCNMHQYTICRWRDLKRRKSPFLCGKQNSHCPQSVTQSLLWFLPVPPSFNNTHWKILKKHYSVAEIWILARFFPPLNCILHVNHTVMCGIMMSTTFDLGPPFKYSCNASFEKNRM